MYDTVKPLSKGHPKCHRKLAFQDNWLLIRGQFTGHLKLIKWPANAKFTGLSWTSWKGGCSWEGTSWKRFYCMSCTMCTVWGKYEIIYSSSSGLWSMVHTFRNFTIINCGLSCSPFWSVVFHCCGVGKPFQSLHPNCCLVFQRFVVNFLECTCLCYYGWLLLFLSLGRWLCWWTRSPRGYLQPSSHLWHDDILNIP